MHSWPTLWVCEKFKHKNTTSIKEFDFTTPERTPLAPLQQNRLWLPTCSDGVLLSWCSQNICDTDAPTMFLHSQRSQQSSCFTHLTHQQEFGGLQATALAPEISIIQFCLYSERKGPYIYVHWVSPAEDNSKSGGAIWCNRKPTPLRWQHQCFSQSPF